jgi:hypothetical protein
MTVTGKLARVMAIGGESTGWTIQLDSEAAIDGKQVNSIEVDSRKTKRLEKLENKADELLISTKELLGRRRFLVADHDSMSDSAILHRQKVNSLNHDPRGPTSLPSSQEAQTLMLPRKTSTAARAKRSSSASFSCLPTPAKRR